MALFIPAVRKIRLERSETLNLFLSIPKTNINIIYSSLSNEEKNDETIRVTPEKRQLFNLKKNILGF